jgi:hypothetical protein
VTTKRGLSAAGAAAACVSMWIGATTASAHTQTFPTNLVQQGSGQSSMPGFYAYNTSGHLDSVRAACVSDRTIKFSFRDDGAKTLMDVDRSSRNGFWAVGGEGTEPPDSFLLKLTSKRLKSPSGHRHVCGGNKLTVFPI